MLTWEKRQEEGSQKAKSEKVRRKSLEGREIKKSTL